MDLYMYLMALALLLVLFYPFSGAHFFSPSHPDLLFMFSHASPDHLTYNLLSLLLIWFISARYNISERNLIRAFFLSSVFALFISYLFSLPVMGASSGIYGMIGYILPYLSPYVPLEISYFTMFLSALLDETGYEWSKLFHVFSLTFGLLLKYFEDRKNFSRAVELLTGRGYAVLGFGYFPWGYELDYKIEK